MGRNNRDPNLWMGTDVNLKFWAMEGGAKQLSFIKYLKNLYEKVCLITGAFGKCKPGNNIGANLYRSRERVYPPE